VADGNRNEELDGLLDLHAVDILEDELRAILSDAVHTETVCSLDLGSLCGDRFIHYVVAVGILLQVGLGICKVPCGSIHCIVGIEFGSIFLLLARTGRHLSHDVVLEVGHREGFRTVNLGPADNLVYEVCIGQLGVDLKRFDEVDIEVGQFNVVVGIDCSPNLERSLLFQDTDAGFVVEYLYGDVSSGSSVYGARVRGFRSVPVVTHTVVVELNGIQSALFQRVTRLVGFAGRFGVASQCGSVTRSRLFLGELDIPFAAGKHIFDRFAVGEQTVEFITVCAGRICTGRIVLDGINICQRVIRVPERGVVTVDRRQGRLLNVHNERESEFALICVLCGNRHIDNLLHFLAGDQVCDHIADLLRRQRPCEGGSRLGSGGIEIVNQLDTIGSSLSHCTHGMVGCGNFGCGIGCDELSLRQTILTELAEHLGNHLFPSERTGESVASQRVVERLENLQINRSDLLPQPLHLEITDIDDGVLVVYVNQLDANDRRLVDGCLVVGRSVGQFRGQRPCAVRIGYAGEFLLVGIVVTYRIRLGRQCETELKAGGFQCLFGDFLGFVVIDIAAGNHRQQVDRFVVCFGERRIGSLCILVFSREMIVGCSFVALELAICRFTRVQVDQSCDFRFDGRFGQRDIIRIYSSAYFAFAEVFVCEGYFQSSRVNMVSIQRKSGACSLLHVYGQHAASDIP